MITRRGVLVGGAALVARAALASAPRRAPALFVQHGPYFPLEPALSSRLSGWGKTLPPVRGVVAMTPHFGGRALTFGPAGRARVLYNVPDDVKGQLPPDLRYASPPDEAIASRVGQLLGSQPGRTTKEGLEHTLWMPLLYLLPQASVSVLQLSFPLAPDADLFELGRTLAPLLDEGIAVLGSGSVSHNLAAFASHDPKQGSPAWMREFEQWTKERLLARDLDALRDWLHKAPAPRLNHPDDGAHFRVLLFALGAALGRGGSAPLVLPADTPTCGVQIG